MRSPTCIRSSGEFPGGDFNQGIGAERIARRWKLYIRYGLQTMCEGGGTADATVVELVR